MSSCHVCHQSNGTLIHIDYCSMTGKKEFPSLGSPNYDQRYGFDVHEVCLTKEQKKRAGIREEKR